jgi:hypothetical protein
MRKGEWSYTGSTLPSLTGSRIRMRPAARGAPVGVKRRAVNRSTKVRTSLYIHTVSISTVDDVKCLLHASAV